MEVIYEEIEHEHVTHVGEPLKPLHNSYDAQRHMGTLEDNVSPVTPLSLGSSKKDDDESDDHHSHHDLTPG